MTSPGRPAPAITGDCGWLRPLRPTGERKGGSVVWECLCAPERGGYGRTCLVRACHLRAGKVRSCGCAPRGGLNRKSQRNARWLALVEGGMSLRAIARAEGKSEVTVRQAVRAHQARGKQEET